MMRVLIRNVTQRLCLPPAGETVCRVTCTNYERWQSVSAVLSGRSNDDFSRKAFNDSQKVHGCAKVHKQVIMSRMNQRVS